MLHPERQASNGFWLQPEPQCCNDLLRSQKQSLTHLAFCILVSLCREMLLYQSVQEQSDFLHNIASVLFGGLQHAPVTSSNDDAAAVAETVWKDWEVFQSLQLIGSTMSSTSSSQESYTIRRLKAAITPEEVAWAQSASLHEVATRLKHLAMRISFQMSQADNPNVLRLMADSLEDSVDRVVELHMLLFAVSPEILPQLSELNADTCEAQTAPEVSHQFVLHHTTSGYSQIAT